MFYLWKYSMIYDSKNSNTGLYWEIYYIYCAYYNINIMYTYSIMGSVPIDITVDVATKFL